MARFTSLNNNFRQSVYDYHHHGTVADTELKLTSFHQGSDANR